MTCYYLWENWGPWGLFIVSRAPLSSEPKEFGLFSPSSDLWLKAEMFTDLSQEVWTDSECFPLTNADPNVFQSSLSRGWIYQSIAIY